MSRHGKRAKTKALLSVGIDRELKEELAALAKADNRTLSNYIVTELQKVVAEKLKPPNEGSHRPGAGPTAALSA